MKANGIRRPAMPPNPAPHFIGWLTEIGLTEAAGMGAAPLSWREISAWCERTGIDLDPWEGRLIRRLSADYLTESRKAEIETAPPPWRMLATEGTIAAEIAALDAVLG